MASVTRAVLKATVSSAEALSFDILGVRVHAATMPELNRRITDAVRADKRLVFGCHNLHSVYLYRHDQAMRTFYDLATDIFVDGMPLIGWARLLGFPVNRDHRITWMDWVHPLMQLTAAGGWRVYYLGSEPGVAEMGAELLRQRHHGLQIRTHHGHFDATPGSADNCAIVREINEYRPNLLMVGMGQPRQEKWVLHHAPMLSANAVFTPGACMDYVAGKVSTPWRPLGRLGLEWAYRLATEPRRLAPRYLIEPWSLVGLALQDVRARFRSDKTRP